MQDRTRPEPKRGAAIPRPGIGERFNPRRETCGFYAPDIVTRQLDLTDGQKRLYDRAVRWAGDNGSFWYGFDRIAEELGKSSRQVKRDMSVLEKLGLIEHVRRGKRQSNVYRFLYHPMFESEVTSTSSHPRGEVTDLSGEVTSTSLGEVTPASLESYKGNYARESSSSDFEQPEAGPGAELPNDDDPLVSEEEKTQDPEALQELILSGKEPPTADPLLGTGTLTSAFLKAVAGAIHKSKCSTGFGAMDLDRYPPPDLTIATRIAEEWRRKGTAALLDWIWSTVERRLGQKGHALGAMVYGLYFADSRARANVWEPGRFMSKTIEERVSIQKLRAKREMEDSRPNQLMTTPVLLPEAIRILDAGGREWKSAPSERFLWLMDRKAGTISPMALLEAAVAWRSCRACGDAGLIGSAVKGTLGFCQCEIGRQEQLDRGDGYIAAEVERVNSTIKSRLVQALRELKLEFTGDAVEQVDTAVTESDNIIDVHPGAGAEAWCSEPDLKQALIFIDEMRPVRVSAAKSGPNPTVASLRRITQEDIDRAAAENRPHKAVSRREPGSAQSSSCPSNPTAVSGRGWTCMSTVQPKSSHHASRPRRTMGDPTQAQRWLVRLMTEYQFGRVENLRIKAGHPAPDRSLRIIRSARPGRKDAGLKVPVSDDPELKRAVWDLLDQIEQIQDGHIVRLEFRHGLPFLLETTTTTTLGGLSVAPSSELGEKP